MTANAREKKAARALAAERGIRYADALRELRAAEEAAESPQDEATEESVVTMSTKQAR